MRRFYASFTIFPETEDPGQISTRLNLEPTTLWNKGEAYEGKYFDVDTRTVKAIPRRRPRSLWQYCTEEIFKSDKIEDSVLFLLHALEPSASEVRSMLERPEEYFIRFTVWLEASEGHISDDLPSSLLARVAAVCHEFHMVFITLEEEEEE